MVGPRVAAAAAQAALVTLTQKDPGPRLAASTAVTMEPPKALLPSSVQQPDRFNLPSAGRFLTFHPNDWFCPNDDSTKWRFS
jgi:hypothetical protein